MNRGFQIICTVALFLLGTASQADSIRCARDGYCHYYDGNGGDLGTVDDSSCGNYSVKCEWNVLVWYNACGRPIGTGDSCR